jgi:hypothetical protein
MGFNAPPGWQFEIRTETSTEEPRPLWYRRPLWSSIAATAIDDAVNG